MSTPYEQVAEFHRAARLTVGDSSTPLSTDATLRIDLITEELQELKDALALSDRVGVADALADLMYVVVGAAVTWGIPLEKCFDEVHRSNMTKTRDPVFRADGKLGKGPHYVPPDLARVLSEVHESTSEFQVSQRVSVIGYPPWNAYGPAEIAEVRTHSVSLRWPERGLSVAVSPSDVELFAEPDIAVQLDAIVEPDRIDAKIATELDAILARGGSVVRVSRDGRSLVVQCPKCDVTHALIIRRANVPGDELRMVCACGTEKLFSIPSTAA